jgi:hypothetical protein
MMELAGQLANVGEKRYDYKILVANLKGISKVEGIGLD